MTIGKAAIFGSLFGFMIALGEFLESTKVRAEQRTLAYIAAGTIGILIVRRFAWR